MFGTPGTPLEVYRWHPNKGVHLFASSLLYKHLFPLNQHRDFFPQRSAHLRGITTPFANVGFFCLFYFTVVLLVETLCTLAWNEPVLVRG